MCTCRFKLKLLISYISTFFISRMLKIVNRYRDYLFLLECSWSKSKPPDWQPLFSLSWKRRNKTQDLKQKNITCISQHVVPQTKGELKGSASHEWNTTGVDHKLTRHRLPQRCGVSHTYWYISGMLLIQTI